MGSMVFFGFFFFFSFLFVLLYQNNHPRKIIEATSQKKVGRDRKSRQVKARTTMLEEHTQGRTLSYLFERTLIY